jgi:hypothetical protein
MPFPKLLLHPVILDLIEFWGEVDNCPCTGCFEPTGQFSPWDVDPNWLSCDELRAASKGDGRRFRAKTVWPCRTWPSIPMDDVWAYGRSPTAPTLYTVEEIAKALCRHVASEVELYAADKRYDEWRKFIDVQVPGIDFWGKRMLHGSPTTGTDLGRRQRQQLSILYTVSRDFFDACLAIAWKDCELIDLLRLFTGPPEEVRC